MENVAAMRNDRIVLIGVAWRPRSEPGRDSLKRPGVGILAIKDMLPGSVIRMALPHEMDFIFPGIPIHFVRIFGNRIHPAGTVAIDKREVQSVGVRLTLLIDNDMRTLGEVLCRLTQGTAGRLPGGR